MPSQDLSVLGTLHGSAMVHESTIVRSGPGANYHIVGRKHRGETVRPFARTADGRWLQLAKQQWISAPAVDSALRSLPVATVPEAEEAEEATDVSVAWTYYEQGEAQDLRGQYEEALADFDAAIRLAPDIALFYHYRGLVKAQLGRYVEALTDYDAALRLEPRDILTFMNRGAALAELGRHQEAQADYDAALRMEPNDVVGISRPGNGQGPSWRSCRSPSRLRRRVAPGSSTCSGLMQPGMGRGGTRPP